MRKFPAVRLTFERELFKLYAFQWAPKSTSIVESNDRVYFYYRYSKRKFL